MNWIKVDIENLPTGELLAFNGGDYIVGYLYTTGTHVSCDADDQCLEKVTHYALLTKPSDDN